MDKEESAVEPTTESALTGTRVHFVDEELVHHPCYTTHEIDLHFSGPVDIKWANGGTLYSVVHAKPHEHVKRSYHHPHEV